MNFNNFDGNPSFCIYLSLSLCKMQRKSFRSDITGIKKKKESKNYSENNNKASLYRLLQNSFLASVIYDRKMALSAQLQFHLQLKRHGSHDSALFSLLPFPPIANIAAEGTLRECVCERVYGTLFAVVPYPCRYKILPLTG